MFEETHLSPGNLISLLFFNYISLLRLRLKGCKNKGLDPLQIKVSTTVIRRSIFNETKHYHGKI